MLSTIVPFLRDVGLEVETGSVDEGTFLPGIRVDGTTLVVDPERCLHPTDLLHEAGHLAVLPPAERGAADGDFGDDPGAEMGAIAWSYAAARHLDIPTKALFHADGYKGESDWLTATFDAGTYIGLPILTWRGLTTADRYPAMNRWVCEEMEG